MDRRRVEDVLGLDRSPMWRWRGKEGCGETLAGQCRTWKTGGASGRPKVGETKQHPGETAHAITYVCRKCRGVSMRAEHAEPLVRAIVATRLARPDAVDLVRDAQHDAEAAAQLREQRITLTAKLDEIADMLADDEMTREQAASATARVKDRLADLDTQDVDHDRARALDGLPLGTPEVAATLDSLTPDRWRAVCRLVCRVTVLPVGRGRGHLVEHRDRLQVERIN